MEHTFTFGAKSIMPKNGTTIHLHLAQIHNAEEPKGGPYIYIWRKIHNTEEREGGPYIYIRRKIHNAEEREGGPYIYIWLKIHNAEEREGGPYSYIWRKIRGTSRSSALWILRQMPMYGPPLGHGKKAFNNMQPSVPENITSDLTRYLHLS